MSAAYESIILFGVLFFFGYLFSALLQFRGDSPGLRFAFQLYLFVLLGIYFVVFWSDGRRSLPMKTMDLALHCSDGRTQVSRLRAACRYSIASLLFWGLAGLAWRHSPLWVAAWLLPYAWCLVDGDHQTLYDRLCATRLVRVPPLAKQR